MSTIQAANISDGTDTVGTGYVINGSAKAWVKFDATTVSVEDSYNQTSITDNGAGDFSLNVTNAFSSTAYVSSGSLGTNTTVTSSSSSIRTFLEATTSARFGTASIASGVTLADFNNTGFLVIGDLA